MRRGGAPAEPPGRGPLFEFCSHGETNHSAESIKQFLPFRKGKTSRKHPGRGDTLHYRVAANWRSPHFSGMIFSLGEASYYNWLGYGNSYFSDWRCSGELAFAAFFSSASYLRRYFGGGRQSAATRAEARVVARRTSRNWARNRPPADS
jgi:hypothetical protein